MKPPVSSNPLAECGRVGPEEDSADKRASPARKSVDGPIAASAGTGSICRSRSTTNVKCRGGVDVKGCWQIGHLFCLEP